MNNRLTTSRIPSEKGRCLFLMLQYPDMERSRCLYTDLVEEFKRRGHKVSVVAPATPGQKTGCYSERGYNIVRVATPPLFSSSKYMKGLANVLLPYLYLRAVKHYLTSYCFDHIVIATPPITLYSLVVRLKRRYGAKVYLILRDIFPQNAVDLGFIKKGGFLHRYFSSVEHRLYQVSNAIGCMSPANIGFVERMYPKEFSQKLHLLPNWQKCLPYQTPSDGVLAKYGLKGKFVALFGGNLGPAQQIENILDLARIHRDKEDVVFLIIGKGSDRERIIAARDKAGLTNVQIMKHIPKTEYKELAACCKLGIVSLNGHFTIPNIPSRTLGYWSVKLPVLAIVDKYTDIGPEFLNRHHAGDWCIVGDFDAYKRKFDRFYNDAVLRRTAGENGYRALCSVYTVESTYETIIKMLEV